MKLSTKFAASCHRLVLTGAVLCAPAMLLLGGCQTVKQTSPPGPCTPADPKAVPGQSVPDRFVPIVREEVITEASKLPPCGVIAKSKFEMRAEYDWVPNSNRGKVQLRLGATAVTPEGKDLAGDEIFLNANDRIDFDLKWGSGDPVGRTIYRFVALALRDDVKPGTQIRVWLRDPGTNDGWPGPDDRKGPVAILDVVDKQQPVVQGAAAAKSDDKAEGLRGQSVPDKFEEPTVKEVTQGGAIGFAYNVKGDATSTPVPEVRFEVFTRASDPLFVSKDSSQVATAVPYGPQVFVVNIDEKAIPGDYKVWATLTPFDKLKTGGKFIVFTMKVKAKPTPP